jgi:hypothetical protein
VHFFIYIYAITQRWSAWVEEDNFGAKCATFYMELSASLVKDSFGGYPWKLEYHFHTLAIPRARHLWRPIFREILSIMMGFPYIAHAPWLRVALFNL